MAEYFNIFITCFNRNLLDYNKAAQEALEIYRDREPVKREDFGVPEGMVPLKLRVISDGVGSTVFAHEAISNEEYSSKANTANKESFRSFKEVKDAEESFQLNGLTFEKDDAIYTLVSEEDFQKFINSFFNGFTLFIL